MPTILSNSQQKALTTLARAKTFLGVSGDSQDALLIQLINQATGFIERYTKRKLLSQTYTSEVYDGTGTKELVLKNFPVTALSALQEDVNDDNSESWQTVDSDYYFWYENGIVKAHSFTFQDKPKKYRVTYVAGYLIDFDAENTPASHTLPQELEYACQKLVAVVFNSRKMEGYESYRVGDMAVTMQKASFEDGEIKAILDKYANPTI